MKNRVSKIETSRDRHIFRNPYDKREGFENMYKYIVVCLSIFSKESSCFLEISIVFPQFIRKPMEIYAYVKSNFLLK